MLSTVGIQYLGTAMHHLYSSSIYFVTNRKNLMLRSVMGFYVSSIASRIYLCICVIMLISKGQIEKAWIYFGFINLVGAVMMLRALRE